MDRRSVLGFGLAASTFVLPTATTAQTSDAKAGKELGPGVRQVDLGERESLIPSYKKVRMRDIIIQPGAMTPEREMMNDMVCHLTEGELAVVQNGKQFTVKEGEVWSCAKGLNTEGTQNKGNTVAVMRIIDLLPA
jgi:quercetin dioxygenase-like cupin family protein